MESSAQSPRGRALLHRSGRCDGRRWGTTLAAAAICCLPTGCGFQLAGSGALPESMSRTFLATDEPNSDFYGSLREALRLRGLEVVATEADASARLIISEDSSGQRVLSVTARNIPREYEIFYTVTFGLESSGQRLIESESLIATRSYTFDETEVLAKSREERILRRALADDLARQVVRLIEAAGTRRTTPIG
jgi:LPS-assembly lipoprotein